MLSDIGDISAIQADGAAPSVLAAGGAAGESGVQVVKLKYQGAAHFAASLHQHVITFMSQGPTYCRTSEKPSHMRPRRALWRCCPQASMQPATVARTPLRC